MRRYPARVRIGGRAMLVSTHTNEGGAGLRAKGALSGAFQQGGTVVWGLTGYDLVEQLLQQGADGGAARNAEGHQIGPVDGKILAGEDSLLRQQDPGAGLDPVAGGSPLPVVRVVGKPFSSASKRKNSISGPTLKV